ncbi:MAG: cation:proton antiporter [Bacteroidota bacterium]
MKNAALILICLLVLCFAALPKSAGDTVNSAASDTTAYQSTSQPTSHLDPVTPILLALIIILIAAKIGGELAERLHQPAVLGELLFGVILGNIGMLFPESSLMNFFAPFRTEHLTVQWAVVVDRIARIGIIILLFQAGLESNIHEMKKVGVPSFIVATLGVIAPFILGFFASKYFFSAEPDAVHIFTGAVLCATSVGITARVMKDLNKMHTGEAKIILGAAVIDDVLGLIVLAVVVGIVSTGSFSFVDILIISLKAVLFFVGAIVLGTKLFPIIGRWISRMTVDGMKVVTSLIFAFFLSWIASLIGLAPIVGAFAAGLVLEDVHFVGNGEEKHTVELVQPIYHFLVPVFFVLMGIQVKLATFFQPDLLGVGIAITAAAIVGKQICGLGVSKNYDRLTIGFGMIPRGEVGLIVAGMGKSMQMLWVHPDGSQQMIPVISDAVFSAVVMMVMITTLVTPPLLKYSFNRKSRYKTTF